MVGLHNFKRWPWQLGTSHRFPTKIPELGRERGCQFQVRGLALASLKAVECIRISVSDLMKRCGRLGNFHEFLGTVSGANARLTFDQELTLRPI